MLVTLFYTRECLEVNEFWKIRHSEWFSWHFEFTFQVQGGKHFKCLFGKLKSNWLNYLKRQCCWSIYYKRWHCCSWKFCCKKWQNAGRNSTGAIETIIGKTLVAAGIVTRKLRDVTKLVTKKRCSIAEQLLEKKCTAAETVTRIDIVVLCSWSM